MELYLSLAAITISLLSLYVSFRAFHRDQGKIEIRGIELCHPGERGTHFLVTVVNSGRRPVHLDKACLNTKTGNKHTQYFYVYSSSGVSFPKPKELSEGEKQEIRFEVFELESGVYGELIPSSRVAINPLEVTGAEVIDTTGKKYKRKLTRRQRQSIAARWSGDT